MLLGENRGRHEHRHLLPGLDRLERGPDGDFGLAVPDVADQQAVHGAGPLHVPLHFFRSATLVGRILVEERRLELALPRRVGREREARRDLAMRVQVEQLQSHLPDRGPRPLPLALPGGGSQAVQLGRRGVAVAARAVRLELVQPVQRDVQAVPALVLDDRDLEGALADRNRLHAPVDPDAVLEVDDVVPRLERPRRGGGRCGPVASRPPQATRPAKDLVIRHHPQRRQHEPAVERAHDERGRLGAQQLLEALQLAFVVAQDHGRWIGRHDAAQPLQIAVDRLGRRDREPGRGVRGVQRDPREGRQPLPPALWLEEDLLARR